MKETVYIVKGIVQQHQADEDLWPQEAVGKAEWMFSDGPSGKRGGSADFIDLREGLEAHREFNLNVDEADFTADERAIFDAFMAGELA